MKVLPVVASAVLLLVLLPGAAKGQANPGSVDKPR